MSKILYFTRTMNTGGTEKIILQLCEIMKDKAEVLVCSCGGIHIPTLAGMGIRHYVIGDITDRSPQNVISVLRSIRKIVISEHVDIIHTHHRMAAFYVRILLKMLRATGENIRFIHTMHNTFYDKKILTKFAIEKAEILAVGKKVMDNLTNVYKIPINQVTVIYNGVSEFDGKINEVELIKKYHEKGYFVIGNCGRLTEQKGMNYFILSMLFLLKKCPKTKAFIIGDGEQKEQLVKLVNNLGLSHDVLFLGYRNDMQSVMSQLDLIVLSSLWEGLPLTPIEAFSVGKTIVATEVDGTVEIVDDRRNGLLVKPKDALGLSVAIEELIKNKKERVQFEINARMTYEEKFSLDIFARAYNLFYNLEGREF